MKSENKTCITPECGKETYARGLCSSCYATAIGLVKTKKTTWETLELRGKALPKISGNRSAYFLS